VSFISEINGSYEEVTHVKGTKISRIQTDKKNLLSILFFLPPCDASLWCRAASSLSALLLDVHKEKGEWDLRTIAVVKSARGTTIRFMGSASV
jgi:hypothetical protein